jgi:hypothetical protein
MKTLILPLSFIVLVSCNKQNQLTWTERQVLGSWYYDEVKFNENWSIGTANVTNEYEDITLTFYDDFTMTSVNTTSGETLTGVWEINVDEDYNNNGNNSGTNEELIASMSDDQTGEAVQLIWEDLSVNKRRIYSYHNNKDGHYFFRLEKF